MKLRRSVGLACAVAFATATWMSTPALAQKKEEKKKLNKAQQDQVQVLFKLTDDVSAGKQPAPSDVALTWQNHFLKAQGTGVYAPYTITVEQGKFTSFPVAAYFRMVPRGGAADAKKDDRNGETKREAYPFEDAFFFDQPKDGKVSRAFSVPSGDYDIYIALKEKPDKKVPQPKTVVFKQPLTVPDLASSLAVSSIIVADKIEPTAPLDPDKQIEQPYSISGIKITPAAGTKFSKNGELNMIFFIYNTGVAADNKPDVEVEYNFHQKAGGTEKFFNKTSPQPFNAQTLPPEFSLTAGHQIIGGQAVPLASFPEGDYRLEIKITDKTSSKSVTRDVNFSVAGS